MSEVLLSRTSKDVHRVKVETTILCPAQPAPLVIALPTCHVVAPRDLLKTNLALRTITHIPHICCPILKLLIHRILTLYVSMPLLPTIKAYLKATLTSDSSILAFREVVITIRPWTPLKVWVNVHINILFELEVFVIYFLWAKLSYFISCELILAFTLRAFDLSYLTIRNIEF